ncbi:MAG: putative metal-binding motif-containing protein, partial [Myxococcota bacterium]
IDEGVGTTYYQDNDADGYGSTTTTVACAKPTGYATVGGDCNDASATVKPGATETCNGVDDNCNGTIDEGASSTTYYQDNDGDGYGSTTTTQACTKPAGYATVGGDCNDANAAVKPGATETCNGIDDNCSGAIDEGVGTTYYQDNDADGYGSTTTTVACAKPTGYATVGGDCNDANAAVKPGATETCNGIDDNCSGTIDEGTSATTWYKDTDGDGQGVSTQTTTACVKPTGYAATSGDCDDADADIYTGAPELCDTKDNDCNGSRDEKIFSGTQPTGYSGTCGVHYMVPVEGMMAASTSVALSPIIVFETINGATTSSFLSGTSGADGHVGNIKGTITGSDGSTYTLGACTVDAKIAYRAVCASIAAGTFKANTTYTFNFTHTQKADGTGWKLAMKGKFTTKSPCGATWNTKPGFKFTKFGSTSSLTLNLMNTAANNNTIQLGATFVDVPKTSTLPVSSFKLALGGFTEASGSASYTYRAPYGASAVIPGVSLNSTGALSLPSGNVSVPTPATSTTMSFMFVYNAVMAGTITSSGNLSTWSGYTLSGIVTKKDMDLFFSDSGNSIGVSYDISNYTPPGGVAQGQAANVTMTATPSSTTMSTAVCP